MFTEAEQCFKIIIFLVISDDAKNKRGCQAKSSFFFFFFFFLKSQFFSSAGNVIQQIKKVLPRVIVSECAVLEGNDTNYRTFMSLSGGNENEIIVKTTADFWHPLLATQGHDLQTRLLG